MKGFSFIPYTSYPIPLAKRGFALLIAVIFMSVMLSFGLTLGALGYKQQMLASGAIESQYAFYAADAGLECALYYDQKQLFFDYASHDSSSDPSTMLVTCDGVLAAPISYSYDGTRLMMSERLSIDSLTAHPRCADVVVYKYSTSPGPTNITTYIFSTGYDVSCATVTSPPAGARLVSRGINAHY